MTVEALFYFGAIAGLVLLWIVVTLILRAFGIRDDWDPTR